MKPQFDIWVETTVGEIFKAFVWCRDQHSGIARACQDGKLHGFDIKHAWAVSH